MLPSSLSTMYEDGNNAFDLIGQCGLAAAKDALSEAEARAALEELAEAGRPAGNCALVTGNWKVPEAAFLVVVLSLDFKICCKAFSGFVTNLAIYIQKCQTTDDTASDNGFVYS